MVGVLIMSIGYDEKSGMPRYTFGIPHLWECVEMILVALGIYGIPETIAMTIGQSSFAREKERQYGSGLMEGVKDGFRSRFFVIRSSDYRQLDRVHSRHRRAR
jgi:TctA family transporter